MTQPILTQEQLKQMLRYDPDTGLFTWIERRQGRSTAEGCAGTTDKAIDYASIGINGTSYKQHIIAWLYVYGCYPKSKLDHINRIKTDNRIANLRELSISLNALNTDAKGWVVWRKKFQASIGINSERIHLGTFTTSEAARDAYLSAKKEHFAKHNEAYA